MKEHTKKLRENRLRQQGLSTTVPKIFPKNELISEDFFMTADPGLVEQSTNEEFSQDAFIMKN